jgi:hypothetical protein
LDSRAGDANLYEYVFNDPTTLKGPLGEGLLDYLKSSAKVGTVIIAIAAAGYAYYRFTDTGAMSPRALCGQHVANETDQSPACEKCCKKELGLGNQVLRPDQQTLVDECVKACNKEATHAAGRS